VQLNDKGEVIDVHRRLELELAIAPMPHKEARQAHELLGTGGVIGKIVLVRNE